MKEPEKPTKKLPTPVRGDIFKARLDPIEGSEQGGNRPVIIVSRNSINANSPVVVIIPTTDAANVKKNYPSHSFLTKGLGGLVMDSIAKAEQLRSIQKSRFIDYYGRLEQSEMAKIDAVIKTTLALR
jgi:mRNA interferase MazF